MAGANAQMGMNKDFSWNASAREYGKIYERVKLMREQPPRLRSVGLEPVSDVKPKGRSGECNGDFQFV